MALSSGPISVVVLALVALIGFSGGKASTQGVVQPGVEPVNNLPNPFETIRNWGRLPEGRTWGSTAAVSIDRDDTSLWVLERCGTSSWQSVGPNSCAGSKLPAVLKFDASGKLTKSFGGGMFIFPHGVHVDRDGSVWVADSRAATPAELETFPDATGKGNQVVKFSPEGKVLLRLGRAGVAGNPPEFLTEPLDVITAPNGDIFVAEGQHRGQNLAAPPDTVARISKFSKDGRFVKTWGRLGSGPGELRTPHGLAFDSRGRLFVADRGNLRIQIFDQEGNYLEAWRQFGRPSDLHIGTNDILYAIDSESGERMNPGWRKGVRIGSARDGKVAYFIPPHQTDHPEGMAGDGVTVDADGNVYAAEVGTDGGPQAVRGLTKYLRRFQLFR